MSREKFPGLEKTVESKITRMPSLAERINALRIRGLYGSFIPQQQLFDLLTPYEIQQELQRHGHPPESLEEHANILAHQGPKTFAILVEIGHVARVADFVSRNLFDGKLDYKEEELKEHFEIGLVTPFMKFQWDYLAPVWGVESSNHKILRPQTILPFVKEVPISEGSSGKIFQVTLSASHQGFVKDAHGPVEIIRKELQSDNVIPDPKKITSAVEKSPDLQDFERETRILKLLGNAQNPHIVDILGSYVLKNVYNILLPRANADLETLLEGKYPDAPKHESGFLEQLCGLASALDSIHCFRNVEKGLDMLGCHLDLKPNNILIFDRTWTLADFGLSRLVPVAQGSKTIFKDCIGDYLAPECLDDDLSQAKIGRKSDIWSLGCIICDVVTFSVLGSKGVSEFRARRKTQSRPGVFDSGFHHQGRLKPEVDRWLTDLTHTIASAASKAMITLARHMLHSCPKNRPDIRTVWIKLIFITLNSITNQIQQQFADVSDQSENLVLLFECARFEQWCQGLETIFPSGPQLEPEHEHVIDAYPKLLIQIRSMHDRLKDFVSSATDIQDSSTVEPHELYLEIRKHNDSLWTEIPSTLRKRMCSHWWRQRLPRTTDAVVPMHHRLQSDLVFQHRQLQHRDCENEIYGRAPTPEIPSRRALFASLPFLRRGIMTRGWGRYISAVAVLRQGIRFILPWRDSIIKRFVIQCRLLLSPLPPSCSDSNRTPHGNNRR